MFLFCISLMITLGYFLVLRLFEQDQKMEQINKEEITMNEDNVLTEAQKQEVDHIVSVLRKRVFEGLDQQTAEWRKTHSTYKDTEWRYWPSSWSDSWFGYKNTEYLFYPFSRDSYPEGSPEYELAEKLCREGDSTLMEPVMAKLLNEWIQEKETVSRDLRIERRVQYVKKAMEESREVADQCEIPVDTVLLIELKEALYKVFNNAKDWEDWEK